MLLVPATVDSNTKPHKDDNNKREAEKKCDDERSTNTSRPRLTNRIYIY